MAKQKNHDLLAWCEGQPNLVANRIRVEKANRAKAIHDLACRHVEKNLREVLNVMTTALAFTFTYVILRSEFKFSAAKCKQFNDKNRSKWWCIDHGYTSYDDIETYEIKSTDKEYSPLKWTGYRWGMISTQTIDRLTKMAVAESDVFVSSVYCHAMAYCDALFGAIELVQLSTLHDFFGFGIKRCQKFSESYRRMLYSTVEEIEEMLKYLKEKGVGHSEYETKCMKKFRWASNLALRPTTAEVEGCLKSRKIYDCVEISCGGSMKQYLDGTTTLVSSAVRGWQKELSFTTNLAG